MRSLCWVALALAACGSDSIGTDPGDGSETLLVIGDVELEDGGARVSIDVTRAGVEVTDALVTVESDLGEVTAVWTSEGEGRYRVVQPGWANEGYHIRVEAGEDWVEGSVRAPELPVLLEPAAGAAFDPHLAEDLIVMVRWGGDEADTVRVEKKDFDSQEIPDVGELGISAALFDEDEDDIEIRRENSVILVGGAPGSRLEAQCETDTRIFVSNPF